MFHHTLILPCDPGSGRLVVPDTEAALNSLRRLLAGKVKRLDLRDDKLDEEEHHYG